MTKKMYKEIEKMIKDKIIKRNPKLAGLIKAEVDGITEGFTMEDAYNGGALIDFDLMTRQKRNQAFESDRDDAREILESSFGRRHLAIYIRNNELSIG